MADDFKSSMECGSQPCRPASAGLTAEKHEAMRLGLTEDIELARAAPGSILHADKIARQYGAAQEALLPVIAELESRGLLRREGANWRVAPIDREALLPKLEVRFALEQEVAEAAAGNVSAINRQEVAMLVGNLRRAALVGDIDGYMRSDRLLEKALAAASGIPETAAKLSGIKSELRRAWCAQNRLGDLSVPADLSGALVDAILNEDAKGAREAVSRFVEYLRQSM